MTSKDFAHLHVHTDYSMLDGASQLDDLLEAAKAQGQNSIAMTDHGNMFGSYEFSKLAAAKGMNGIVGIEAYIAPGDRRTASKEPLRGLTDPIGYTHATLLAENNEGLVNLFKLTSQSYIDGMWSKYGRMDHELLAQHSKGIIATSGCLSGEVKTLLKYGEKQAALEAASEWKDIFGPENFFIEVMDHGITMERMLMPDLLDISKKLNLPLLATNDSHFTHKHQAFAQDALLCMQTASRISDEKRMRFDGEGYHLRSSEEMWEMFGNLDGACQNTLEVADRCRTTFGRRDDVVPVFDVPEGHTEETWLRQEVERGLALRYPNVTDAIRERAEYELSIICNMGYPGYFLVVSDFIKWGKDQGILFGPARGSAGGSLVAYSMFITDVDPVKFNLPFERFLNPERVSMPDIDIDIQDDRRSEVIEYVTRKYGTDKVAQIVTHGTYKAKKAMKDSARVLDQPIALANKLSRLYPKAQQGKEAPIACIKDKNSPRYRDAADIRKLYETDSGAKQVIDLAEQIEGMHSSWGIHASGVIISEKPLNEVVPLIRRNDSAGVAAQYSMGDCEELGLLKMDFLGIKNLTMIANAIQDVKERRGVDIVPNEIPLDDQKTFDLYAAGDTLGVFQLDSPDIRNLLRRMKPDRFEDISATLALYRPGPMGVNAHLKYADRKNGREKIDYIHPELEQALTPILEDTHGVIVYQEQVMEIARELAGYTLGEADLLRRAMGKKKKSEMDILEPEFMNAMKERGYSESSFHAIWDTLLPFADYAFNRAHTVAYGLVSYWTAYLKANYPEEFMAALLSESASDQAKTVEYLADCRRMGIKVTPPDINKSGSVYTPVPEEHSIAFGLGAIKGIGEAPAEAIQKARADKPFESLTDFCQRAPIRTVAVHTLIEAGAMDNLGYTRLGMLEAVDPILKTAQDRAMDAAAGKRDLFWLDEELYGRNTSDPQISDEEWMKSDLLRRENELLGVYVSGHPLDGYMKYINLHSSRSWLEATQLPHGSKVVLGGLLTGVQHKVSKRGNPWAAMNLVGLDGQIEMRCFDKNILEKRRSIFTSQNVVMVKADVDNAEEGQTMQLIVRDIKLVTTTDDQIQDAAEARLRVPMAKLTKDSSVALQQLLARFRGTTGLTIEIEETGKVMSFPNGIKQDPQFKRELLRLFGRNCIVSGFGE